MSDIPTTVEFLSTVEGGKQESPFRLGVVAALFPNSTAKIKFDGEETASEKQYAYLASYMPALNDRVLLAKTAGTYVILGKINYTESPTDPAPEPTSYFTLDGDTLKANYNVSMQGWLDALNNISSNGISRIDGLRVNEDFEHDGSRIGFFGVGPVNRQYCDILSAGATLATVISKVNQVINDLKYYGILG